MKAGMKLLSIVGILVGVFFFQMPSFAQDPGLESVGEFGRINWIDRKVVAAGIGTAPQKYIGKPGARPMAQRAAVTVARRNLLEVIKGVHIDSETRVENSMVKDDRIVSRIRGMLNASNVDGYRYLEDGSVEATVSMALTGQLGEMLLSMAVQHQGVEPAPAPSGIEDRLRQLEKRVMMLEEKLSRFKNIAVDQEETIFILRQFVKALVEHTSHMPQFLPAGYTPDELAELTQKLEKQESRLATLSAKMDDVANRLTSLEKKPVSSVGAARTEEPQKLVPYTGLVIDARGIGFRPCLKPEIFGQKQLIYPSTRIDRFTAVSKGYVRYYRKIDRAQQSARVGSLPYTIKAKGTYKGKRSLEISSETYRTLKAYVDAAAPFMTDCKVVIVF
jgi:uncharacterized coiled-coil protein SlyX